MNYLYHMVPHNMRGNTLFPLNRLKTRNPMVYREAIKKYEGRKHLLQIRVPTLANCLWNDVLHFTAVHPQKIKAALRRAGRSFHHLNRWKWFKINPYYIDPSLTTIFLYKPENEHDRHGKDNFSSFSPEVLNQYNLIPQRTVRYYREEISRDRRPLLFHWVPHILLKSEIDQRNLEVIEV